MVLVKGCNLWLQEARAPVPSLQIGFPGLQLQYVMDWSQYAAIPVQGVGYQGLAAM
jgi:hypothetical protein